MFKKAPSRVSEPRWRALARRLARVPVRLLPAEAAYRARRAAVLAGRRAVDAWRSTYRRGGMPAGDLPAFAPRLDPRRVAELAPDLPERCSRYLERRFDLLGSGWRSVAHGAGCPGFGGHRYQAPAITADPAGNWLEDQVPRPNLAAARAVWRLLRPEYRPVDWHLDFRSGYRWPPRQWYRAVRYGHLPGVDVKVPWELARMQHLPQLALAFGCASAGLPRFRPAGDYRETFRNQVLDFVATNPPRYGIHWHSSLEVAVRLANWLLAYDLFRSYGAAWDPEFDRVFVGSALDHGRHLAGNIERSPAWSNNHYLANLAGLAFAAAYLAPHPDAARWRRTAEDGLAAEIERQFLPDGGHFEASTGYHLFAAELAAYGVAMLLAGRRGGAGPGARLPDSLGNAFGRLGGFLMRLAKPDGRLPPIGDHDSGRLFKLLPRRRAGAGADGGGATALDEEHLDARPALAAVNGLLGRPDFSRRCGGRRPEESLVAGLAGDTPWRRPAPGASLPAPAAGGRAPGFEALAARLRAAPAVESSRVVLAAPGPSLGAGMEVSAFPDFGAYVFRSERLYLCLRAGFGRDDGTGGHAHVDQLALEVAIDGADWIRDPGSYVYTADPELRNAYRSSAAHFTPYMLDGEPWLWRRGLFDLRLDVRVREAAAGPGGAAVDLLLAGARIGHTVAIGAEEIVVETRILYRPAGGPLRVRCRPDRAGRYEFGGAPLPGAVPFAPGYGLRETGSDPAP